jgi:hypothetical protein
VELIDQSGAGGRNGVDDDDDMPDGCWYVPGAGTANWGFVLCGVVLVVLIMNLILGNNKYFSYWC